MISAAVALLGVLAAVLLRPVSLRTSLDLADTAKAVAVAADAASPEAPPEGQVTLDTRAR
jgi:hypothetical protein